MPTDRWIRFLGRSRIPRRRFCKKTVNPPPAPSNLLPSAPAADGASRAQCRFRGPRCKADRQRASRQSKPNISFCMQRLAAGDASFQKAALRSFKARVSSSSASCRSPDRGVRRLSASSVASFTIKVSAHSLPHTACCVGGAEKPAC